VFIKDGYSSLNSRANTVQSEKFLCTLKYKNHIRENPTTRSPIKASIGRYVPLKIIKVSKNWFKIKSYKYNSIHGWIHHSIVSSKINCMLITKSYDILCPGQKKKKRIFYMHEGFKIIKREIACNIVEDQFGKKFKISSLHSWPNSATKMIKI
jgi:hypothetical protein